MNSCLTLLVSGLWKWLTIMLSWSFYWQQAVVGNNDRIIPPDNQLNAWRKEEEISQKNLRVHYTEDAHYQVELFRYYLQEIWTKN